MWGWLSDPLWYTNAPDESVGFVSEWSGESQFVTSTEWEKRDGRWTCTIATGEATPFALAMGVRVGNLQDYVLGDLLGPDEVDGHAAYKFYNLDRTTGREITYWLDAETLWLRQYEYEGGGCDESGCWGEGIRYTVKLEAINAPIRIEPPDVDVPCLEEEPPGP